MILPPTDADLLARHQRKRRWTIRICLSSLFILLLMVIVVSFLLVPMGMTFEEAEAIIEQLDSNGKYTRADFEVFLGKPNAEWKVGGRLNLYWVYYKQSLNLIEYSGYEVRCFDDGRIEKWFMFTGQTANWKAAWNLRWKLLKVRLGIDVMKTPSY